MREASSIWESISSEHSVKTKAVYTTLATRGNCCARDNVLFETTYESNVSMRVWYISVGNIAYQVVNTMGWSTCYLRRYSATAILLGYIANAIANSTALQQAYHQQCWLVNGAVVPAFVYFWSGCESNSRWYPVSSHVSRGSSALVATEGM